MKNQTGSNMHGTFAMAGQNSKFATSDLKIIRISEPL